MKIISLFIIQLLICYIVSGQSDVIYLQDSVLNMDCRLHVVADSVLHDDEGNKYEYFRINSLQLIPTLENCKYLFIRIKTSQNGKTIKQYFSSEGKSSWVSPFNNGAVYQLVFIDSMDVSKKVYAQFKIEKTDNGLVLSTKDFFWGQVLHKDSTTSIFIIRPYIIPQNNINLAKITHSGDTITEILEFGETFELFGKNFRLSEFDFIAKTIRLDSVAYPESSFGYKQGKLLKNFAKTKAWITANLVNKRIMYDSDYYLFYFWGEWCQPCWKKFDLNNALFTKIDSKKVNVVNVALSITAESRSKTLNLIEEKQIKGFHLIENQLQYEEGLIKKLNIHTYPSYVVIDKTGEVVFRTDYNNKINIEEFLSEKKLFKKE
ncbi:MAG TPA: thioredoxin-like domain-containing protein [Saprospiraceae bacterium]|nr:thioredoxin-like domain-containing protein [Saprospiraceae bacterium]HMP24608.1 thioredoxin-like domain-containing protein [Saprospiraceae bacterium]